jgi:F-type H+-transporting ATPase subunit gamma
MSDSLDRLRSKISRGRKLGSVVHAMKALATLRIGQFEQAVRSLDRYMQNVERGLSVCLRSGPVMPDVERRPTDVVVVVFGSDQGLVGRFNETIREYAQPVLAPHGRGVRLWAVGERLAADFEDHGVSCEQVLAVPGSVAAIAPLVASLLGHLDGLRAGFPGVNVYLVFNRFEGAASVTPVSERLLPFDAAWERRFARAQWPTRNLPEPVGAAGPLLGALIREYLFGSLFRACAESISSENASRLAAMQRAERNIDSLVESLGLAYNGLRQSAIDEELFDVVAGFEALPGRPRA